MNKHNTKQRQRLTVGLTVMAVAIGAVLALGGTRSVWSPIASAQAQDSHGGSQTSGDHGTGEKGSKGSKGQGGKSATTGSGQHGSSGSKSVESKVLSGDAEESSDRRGPKYGGGKTPGKPAGAGSKKGDLYGDLNVILRDANGVPILDQYGHVQPLDASGNPLPLTPEGDIAPGSEDLVVPVEFSRLSVARSPSKVTDKSYAEAISTLNSATAITVDSSGRLVATVDGVAKTIDSPLENLALYEALLNKGYLPGLDLKEGVSLGNLSFLADQSLTNKDMLQAASFLAAASDKFGSINQDTVVYSDSIMGVTGLTPVTGADGKSYVDFSKVTYDRGDTYSGDITYLKSNGDGTYAAVTAPIMTAVFGGTDYSGTQLDAFTQAADDARAVILFVHENPLPSQ
jgi:hypothetical protein